MVKLRSKLSKKIHLDFSISSINIGEYGQGHDEEEAMLSNK